MKIEGVRSQATIYLQQALNLGKNGEVKPILVKFCKTIIMR